MDLENLRNVEMLNFSSDEEEVEELPMRAPKRYLRDYQNPFEVYSEWEFKRRFRFFKNSVTFGILPLVKEGLAKINNRGLPISPILQLLICLRFYSTASFQLVLGDIITISQPTILRIVFRVSILLASYINRYIKIPSSEESRSVNKRIFRELGRGHGGIGLPSIDGAIDCTHIRLVHTRLQNVDEIFRNRKGYFSLNVQIIVGPRTEILDIVPEWPGSEHDSRIFQNSRIYMRYRQGELDGILVGDAGYPALPFLLTPIGNPTTDEEMRFDICMSVKREENPVRETMRTKAEKKITDPRIHTSTPIPDSNHESDKENVSSDVDTTIPLDDSDHEESLEQLIQSSQQIQGDDAATADSQRE
ncbi:putative nuclease HARBI1 [Temnothorax nylanderi]|uniref:putative nuclease HARBI1 n=1 Tax=Temnothorax nylanderi TaxID=102681 RepID=UPI003A8BB49C